MSHPYKSRFEINQKLVFQLECLIEYFLNSTTISSDLEFDKNESYRQIGTALNEKSETFSKHPSQDAA